MSTDAWRARFQLASQKPKKETAAKEQVKRNGKKSKFSRHFLMSLTHILRQTLSAVTPRPPMKRND